VPNVIFGLHTLKHIRIQSMHLYVLPNPCYYCGSRFFCFFMVKVFYSFR